MPQVTKTQTLTTRDGYPLPVTHTAISSSEKTAEDLISFWFDGREKAVSKMTLDEVKVWRPQWFDCEARND